MRQTVAVKGARENNLQNIEVEIPRDQLVVVTGISGSGKSSLAFDTVYAEGQRRFLESMSTYAKRFITQLKKPDVDFIDGLSPVVSIEQKTVTMNPRSTVGTMTDLQDYLRMLFATIGIAHCPYCEAESRSVRIIRYSNACSRCQKAPKSKFTPQSSKSTAKITTISSTTSAQRDADTSGLTALNTTSAKKLNSIRIKNTTSK